MALWRYVVFWLLAPAAALALDLRPAEPPPPDFDARQYIDSRGCVFLRDGAGGWNARQARDGSAICGYPPSLAQRGLDGRPRLHVLDPNAGKTRAELASEALEQVVTTQLRDGELASDRHPLEVLPDMGPEPHSTEPMNDLKAALRAAPAVRHGMSRDLQPNRRLCELLGYDGKPGTGNAAAGQDPTKGYCGSLPDTDLSRLAFERPLSSVQVKASKMVPTTEAKVAKAMPPVVVKPAIQVAGPSAGTRMAKPVLAKPPAGPTGKTDEALAKSAVGMIPPGARYVQIGIYPDAANADQAARRAVALGYPVLRGKERGKPGPSQLVMVGPFDNREAIVRALDALRKAGFRNAYPR